MKTSAKYFGLAVRPLAR